MASAQIGITDPRLPQFCSEIATGMRENAPGVSERLNVLFNALSSELVKSAEAIFNALHERENLGIQQLIPASLPKDQESLKAIVDKDASSTHPVLRERALIAASHLEPGSETFARIARIARRNLEFSGDKEEGYCYFLLLLKHPKISLPEQAFFEAIKIARKQIAHPHRRVQAMAEKEFFLAVFEKANGADVYKMMKALLKDCTEKQYHILLKLCEKLLEGEALIAPMMDIVLAATAKGFLFEKKELRQQAFKLADILLNRFPEKGLDVLLRGMIAESKRNKPCREIWQKLDIYAENDLTYVSERAKAVISGRKKQDLNTIFTVLGNLSISPLEDVKETAENLLAVLRVRRPFIMNDLT